MFQTTVKIDGMMCGMCEAHINEVIRKLYPKAKKVSSSHTKGETTFLTEETVSGDDVRKAVDATGYRFISISCKPYEKRGLFGR